VDSRSVPLSVLHEALVETDTMTLLAEFAADRRADRHTGPSAGESVD
jgi:hypothetical protein